MQKIKEPQFVLIHRQRLSELHEALPKTRNLNWLSTVEMVEFVRKILMDMIPTPLKVKQ